VFGSSAGVNTPTAAVNHSPPQESISERIFEVVKKAAFRVQGTLLPEWTGLVAPGSPRGGGCGGSERPARASCSPVDPSRRVLCVSQANQDTVANGWAADGSPRLYPPAVTGPRPSPPPPPLRPPLLELLHPSPDCTRDAFRRLAASKHGPADRRFARKPLPVSYYIFWRFGIFSGIHEEGGGTHCTERQGLVASQGLPSERTICVTMFGGWAPSKVFGMSH